MHKAGLPLRGAGAVAGGAGLRGTHCPPHAVSLPPPRLGPALLQGPRPGPAEAPVARLESHSARAGGSAGRAEPGCPSRPTISARHCCVHLHPGDGHPDPAGPRAAAECWRPGTAASADPDPRCRLPPRPPQRPVRECPHDLRVGNVLPPGTQARGSLAKVGTATLSRSHFCPSRSWVPGSTLLRA